MSSVSTIQSEDAKNIGMSENVLGWVNPVLPTSEEQREIINAFSGTEQLGNPTIDLLIRTLDKIERSEVLTYLNNLKYILENFRSVDSFAKLSIRLNDPLGTDIRAVMRSTHGHWRDLKFPLEQRTYGNKTDIVLGFSVEELLRGQNPSAESILITINTFRDKMYGSSEFNEKATFEFIIYIGTCFERNADLIKTSNPDKSKVYDSVAKEFLSLVISYANPIIIESAIKFIREKRPQLMPES